jgi:DNA-binding SARP family transcriptional activator
MTDAGAGTMSASERHPFQILANQFLITSDIASGQALLAMPTQNPQASAFQDLVRLEYGRHTGGAVGAGPNLLDHADPAVRGRAHIIAARFAIQSLRHDDARRHVAAAFAALAAPDTLGIALATMAAGANEVFAGCYGLAQDRFISALALYEACDDPIGCSSALRMLITLALNTGDLGYIDDWIVRADAAYRSTAWAPTSSFLLYRATAAYMRGRYAEASTLAGDGLALATAMEHVAAGGMLHHIRGWIRISLGDLPGARADFEAGLPEGPDDGAARYTGALLRLGLAETARLGRDLPAARRWSDLVRADLAARGHEAVAARWRLGRCRLLVDEGRLDEALTLARHHLDTAIRQATPLAAYDAHDLLAAIADRTGDTAMGRSSRDARDDLGRTHGMAFAIPWSMVPAVAAPPAAIAIRCFDGFTVTLAGDPVLPAAWRGHRVKLLLAALLLHRGGLTKDALTNLLYPKQHAARSSIAVLVNRLRRAFDSILLPGEGRTVVWDNGRYRLDAPAGICCDLWTFEDACLRLAGAVDDDARAAACREMLAACGGPLFTGFHDEAWIVVAHQRTRRQWQEAHSWLQAWTLRTAGEEAALAVADANLEQDPAAEPAHVFKIRTLLDHGRHDAARRQYWTMCQCLLEVHGSEPGPEARALLPRLRH